jgi:D-alanyl-D-alanine dipeptidase
MRYHTLLLAAGVLVISLFGCASQTHRVGNGLPDGFVYLSDVDPTIIEEMRYFGNHNFMGRPITGYESPRCILTEAAAKGLAAVQAELKEYSMSLKVYDCYRPQRAVDSFVLWAKDLTDRKTMKEFYPKVDKSNLFRDGYIAEKSGHSRGSTMDLTVVPLPAPKQSTYEDGMKLAECYLPEGKRFNDNSLDFGTGFDCFDPLAHTANPLISLAQKQRRLMLKSLMEKNGLMVALHT